jgi:hypothetical protein
MPFSLRWRLACGATLLFAVQFPSFLAAENTLDPPATLPLSSLRLLARNSGYIFDGTVLSVERIAPPNPASPEVLQISFRVEQAIRGVRNGQVLTICEWAGLWSSGERYRTGERLLLFLYSPGKLGLSSPVAGSLGRFAVDSGGNAIFDNARLAALSPNRSQANSAFPASRAGQTRINTRALALAIQQMDRE